MGRGELAMRRLPRTGRIYFNHDTFIYFNDGLNFCTILGGGHP